MQVKYDVSYERALKRLIKKDKELSKIIDYTIEILSNNKEDNRLNFKKIICQKDKNRYSIRVISTSFRILLSYYENQEFRLICVCNHDKYNYYNKNC